MVKDKVEPEKDDKDKLRGIPFFLQVLGEEENIESMIGPELIALKPPLLAGTDPEAPE